MNKTVTRSLIKSLGWNILAGIVGMLPFIFLKGDAPIGWGLILIAVAILSLLTQLVIALAYINDPAKKEIGQGMLISVGIFLLIGLCVCSPVFI